jgi:hypothetical protein
MLRSRVIVRRAVAVFELWRGGKLVQAAQGVNLLTDAGTDFIHEQVYGTSPGANGLNYIALSPDVVTETAASTTLSNEIVGGGLTRAQGTVTHVAGTPSTTITKTFNVSAPQTVKKAALFTANAAGSMNHVLATDQTFNLVNGDVFTVTYLLSTAEG